MLSTVYYFSAVSFDAAHDDHNNLNFCIYCHFNCDLVKFIDITCICRDLFLCSYQYIQQNVSKSSNALRMKHIKNTSCTIKNHDNFQNKQEYCI